MKSWIVIILSVFTSTSAFAGVCYVNVNFWNKSTTARLPNVSSRAACFAYLDSEEKLKKAASIAIGEYFFDQCVAEGFREDDSHVERCVSHYLKSVFSEVNKHPFSASVTYSVESKEIKLKPSLKL